MMFGYYLEEYFCRSMGVIWIIKVGKMILYYVLEDLDGDLLVQFENQGVRVGSYICIKGRSYVRQRMYGFIFLESFEFIFGLQFLTSLFIVFFIFRGVQLTENKFDMGENLFIYMRFFFVNDYFKNKGKFVKFYYGMYGFRYKILFFKK